MSSQTLSPSKKHPRCMVLGLDPGTVKTGFAVVALEKGAMSLVDFGVLLAPVKAPLPERLFHIGKGLKGLYKKHSIADTALEQIFFGKNPDSAFKLGQAFGICVYQAIDSRSKVFTYAARYVKQSVTGSGNADKNSVKTFVLNIFGLKESAEGHLVSDATDALAVALCHIYEKQKVDVPKGAL